MSPVGTCHRCGEGSCICREVEPVVTEHDLALETLWQAGKYLTSNRDDAVLVLARLASRLVAGGKTYGPLDLKRDKRSLLSEARDEAIDQLFYLEAEIKRSE